MDIAMTTDELLTPPQVARLLGVSAQTLAVWRCEDRYPLTYIKIGACVRYRRSDVERFIEQGASDAQHAKRSARR